MKNEEIEAGSCRSEKIKQLLFTSVKGYRISHDLPERINEKNTVLYSGNSFMLSLLLFLFSLLSFSDLIFWVTFGYLKVCSILKCTHTFFLIRSELFQGLEKD